MFCPRCGSECREEFTECADCRVPLVREPPSPKAQYVEYEPLLATYNPGDIAVIKALLESEGIRYFIEGEFFNMVRPLVEPAKLLVDKEQIQKAREVLKGMKFSYVAFGRRSGRSDTAPES